MIRKPKKRIFLDYASTTPIDKKVLRAMLPYLEKSFENPSALYKEGVDAKRRIEDARRTIALILHVEPSDIVFTASGTEADNLALLGIYESACVWRTDIKPHIITTTIEHPAVLEACREIERRGGEVTYVEVDESGIVSPDAIRQALTPATILVSVMYANNEIGTIQPVKEISKVIRTYSTAHPASKVYFHTDASQAPNYLSVNCESLGVDLMTLDASKIYGPKGIGLLVAKKHVGISPIIFGGGQEKGLRSGTENVPAIVGFAEALIRAEAMREKESGRLKALRDYFISEMRNRYPIFRLNGDAEHRLPNNINVCAPGLDAEFAVLQLDTLGISCSSASACKSLSEISSSYVIENLGQQGKECGTSSLRFTLGRGTTKAHVTSTLRALEHVLKLQNML
jgi:cysteine desulfurase